ncbi:MAG: peptidoglycan DD-metalloendopeptidase family protein, partial [Nitrospirota bacterium]|nr:peptidoglycan DD-metalloendopeptidase family protein [Nitrospirota bacterium]
LYNKVLGNFKLGAWMKKSIIIAVFLIITFFTLRANFDSGHKKEKDLSSETVAIDESSPPEEYREIKGSIRKGETLFDIFKKYGISIADLFRLKEASADVHRLRELYPGRQYSIMLDTDDRIKSFVYWINDDTILNITRTESGFNAEKVAVQYQKKILNITGVIEDNLVSAIGNGRENLMVALELSDIFAWDIDFTTDFRKGDLVKVIVEGLYLDGKFRKYGNILSAEFQNNGDIYRAYRFGDGDDADYFDPEGKSLRKAFLKAPLNYRRISSGFSNGRFHPILKINRPHHGIDYSAPRGTPVSVVGDGTVIFAGYKGQFGKLVIVKHHNGYKTYYGHLSRIGKGIKKGTKVKQGQIIARVGATGLATGPHLHYEMRVNNKPVNPYRIKAPRVDSVPERLMAGFRKYRDEMNARLTSLKPPVLALAEEKSGDRI